MFGTSLELPFVSLALESFRFALVWLRNCVGFGFNFKDKRAKTDFATEVDSYTSQAGSALRLQLQVQVRGLDKSPVEVSNQDMRLTV